MERMDWNRVELLAPAGDLEKLKFAIMYGADAVYIGGQSFGLRAAAKNFSFEEMAEGVRYAHKHGVRVYLTLNIIPHDADLDHLAAYLAEVEKTGVDAVILSDPGTLMYVKQYLPNMEIHLSTQANNTNSMSAQFWHMQGVKRIVLARELSFEEIATIRKNTPMSLDFEAFVHGAMCISYSGRCLLSNYMASRDANQGACAQPCRWNYSVVEKTRPDEEYPVEETEEGTFIFNSKDLCMIEHIPALVKAGLHSLKIEGRMKTFYYVASVVRVYRKALDEFYRDPEHYEFRQEWLEELTKVSHREYTTAFYEGKAGASAQNYKSASYVREYDFSGVVLEYDPETKLAKIEQRNHFKVGMQAEFIGPAYRYETQTITELYNEKMEPITVAPHARQIVFMKMDEPVEAHFLMRTPKIAGETPEGA